MQTSHVLLLLVAEANEEGAVAFREVEQHRDTGEQMVWMMNRIRLFSECGVPAALFRQEHRKPETRRLLFMPPSYQEHQCEWRNAAE